MTEVLTSKSIGGLPVVPVSEKMAYINLLLYGQPGAGKTICAGSADAVPELRKVLFIDIEGGTFSIRERFPEVDVVRVETWAQMQEVYNELYLTKGAGYNTVVLDSLTEIQKFSMYNIMIELQRRKDDVDPDIPGMREWGKNIEQIRKLVRAFRDLPMNTIFTCLSTTEKDSKTGVVTTKPQLSGKLANEVAGFMDIVAFMYTKVENDELKRLMLTATTDQYVAKDRSGKLPMVIQDPDMRTLYDHIFDTETVTS